MEPPTRTTVKRSASTDFDDTIESKKPKYANGTASPVDTMKLDDLDDEKDEKVTVSSTAANLYAALAADIIENDTDLLDEQIDMKEETLSEIKQEIKEEIKVPGK